MPEKGALSLESVDSALVGDLPILHIGAEGITIDPEAPLSHSRDFGKMFVRQLPLPWSLPNGWGTSRPPCGWRLRAGSR